MAWVLDLGKSFLERGLKQGSWSSARSSSQAPRRGYWSSECIVGELNAEMSPAREADHEHGLIDAGNSTVRTGLPRTVSRHWASSRRR
jgi:hypothetical protein